MQMLLNKWTQTAALILAVMLVGTGTSFAQVAVSMNDITGRPGETATVSVMVDGVEAGADIQSFGFFVTTDAGITFTGHSTDATLSGDAGFNVNSNTGNGGVGGFSQGTDISMSGKLVDLNFDLDTDGAMGNITLTGFVLNGGTPAVTGTFTSSFTVSNRILNVSDASVGESSSFELMFNLEDALVDADDVISFNFDVNYDPSLMTIDKTMGVEGVVVAGVTETSVSVSGNDVDADTYRIAGFATGGEMTGDGLFVKLAATSAAGSGTAPVEVTNIVFNAGSPIYAGRSGTLTVNAINFAPVFTNELADQTVLEDDGTLMFDYDATDANGDAITYSLSGPGMIDSATGEWSLDLDGNAGVHVISVSASDGVNTTTTMATVTIWQVDTFETTLSGVNEVPPTQTPASGWATMRMVADAGLLEVDFYVENLTADMTGAHVHLGGVGENGGVAVNLAPTGDMFSASYDISGASADVIDAIRNGGAYVNVHSAAYPAGEIRGQILSAGNSAPNEAASIAPALVNVAGDATSTAFSISWLPVADPDGDAINYLLQIAMDANFTMVTDLENFGQTNGIAFTIEEAADLFAYLTDNDPNSDGTTAVFYHRVITTDGSLWNAGPASSTSLRRGAITDTETGAELPTEFALKGNYPNPFNPTTSISFDLPESADVTVQVLDLLGREVMAIPSQTMTAGASQTVQINASSLSSGIYLYRVIARGATATYTQVKTMTLLK